MKKFAVVNAWPNLPKTAEREFISRLQIASRRLGWEAVSVNTSAEIEKIVPDFVLATHEYTPKLTKFTTLGAMWSPPEFFEKDVIRTRSILSYDGYLIGSEVVQCYINDLYSTLKGREKKSSDFLFLPSSQKFLNNRRSGEKRSLMYSGVHWDGLRHGELFYRLGEMGLINLYGPSNSWNHIKESYRGEIEFDGVSMLKSIQTHGISLCIHKDAHRVANTPSMRLFEAAAAGSLIITDNTKFAIEEFKDTVFYLDTSLDVVEQIEYVKEKISWAQNNPSKADEMADSSRQIFNEKWSLECLIPKVIDFVGDINVSQEVFGFNNSKKKTLDVIIRCGDRDIQTVERAITSVLTQKYIDARVILVTYRERSDLIGLVSRFKDRILHIKSLPTGYRSTALWDGLKAVNAEYFAMLDDDDSVEPNHWHQLIAQLENNLKYDFAYSGVVRIEEDGAYINAINFSGPLNQVIPENKELKFLDFQDPLRLILFDNYIQSNAWVAKRDLINKINTDDPMLQVAEDMYLYILFYSITDFLFVPIQTANWHWRSISQDNSMLAVSQKSWMDVHDRIHRRLGKLVMRTGHTFQVELTKANYFRESTKIVESTSNPFLIPIDNIFPSHSFDLNEQKDGFYPSELGGCGVWSRNAFSWIKGYLSNFCISAEICINFMVPPHSSGRSQRVKIYVNGISFYDNSPKQWELVEISKKVDFGVFGNAVTLILVVEELFVPSLHVGKEEDRSLGLYLSRFSARPLFNSSLEDINANNTINLKSIENDLSSVKRKSKSVLFSEAALAQKNNDLILLKDVLNQIYRKIDSDCRPASKIELDLINKFEGALKNA